MRALRANQRRLSIIGLEKPEGGVICQPAILNRWATISRKR